MRRGLLALLTAALMIALAGCTSSGEDPAEAAEADDVAVAVEPGADEAAPSPALTSAYLNSVLMAYVRCMEPVLDGFVRANFDRYVGLRFQYGLPDGRPDPQTADELASECEQTSGLADALAKFAPTYVLPPEGLRAIQRDLGECFAGAGMATPRGLVDAETLDDLLVALGDPSFLERSADPEALLSCVDGALYGSQIRF
ncbi:MAG: hypothetical protein AAGA65_11240 [Actinomycetota bacterium]